MIEALVEALDFFLILEEAMIQTETRKGKLESDTNCNDSSPSN